MFPGRVRADSHNFLLYSYDQGVTWDGAVTLTGSTLWEPEGVELPSGDLLIMSSGHGGLDTRQIIHREGRRFLSGPVFDIVSGHVPETAVRTKEGLLVGAFRGGMYSCSKDWGDTWYPIGDIPRALYQPRIIQVDDGRFCCFSHYGADNFVGEVDQYIAMHVFRLEEHLPHPTMLSLTRSRNSAGTQYVNAYAATLTAGDRPVAGKNVKFTVRASSPGRKRYDTREYLRPTDVDGRAQIAVPDFNQCVDIHRDYTIQAEFTPAAGETNLAAARSVKYETYRMTPTVGKKNGYAFYVAQRTLFVAPDVLNDLPEINGLVKTFGLKTSFRWADVERILQLNRARSKQLLHTLRQHNVLRVGKHNACAWNEVELDEVMPITIDDDFVV